MSVSIYRTQWKLTLHQRSWRNNFWKSWIFGFKTATTNCITCNKGIATMLVVYLFVTSWWIHSTCARSQILCAFAYRFEDMSESTGIHISCTCLCSHGSVLSMHHRFRFHIETVLYRSDRYFDLHWSLRETVGTLGFTCFAEHYGRTDRRTYVSEPSVARRCVTLTRRYPLTKYLMNIKSEKLPADTSDIRAAQPPLPLFPLRRPLWYRIAAVIVQFEMGVLSTVEQLTEHILKAFNLWF